MMANNDDEFAPLQPPKSNTVTPNKPKSEPVHKSLKKAIKDPALEEFHKISYQLKWASDQRHSYGEEMRFCQKKLENLVKMRNMQGEIWERAKVGTNKIYEKHTANLAVDFKTTEANKAKADKNCDSLVSDAIAINEASDRDDDAFIREIEAKIRKHQANKKVSKAKREAAVKDAITARDEIFAALDAAYSEAEAIMEENVSAEVKTFLHTTMPSTDYVVHPGGPEAVHEEIMADLDAKILLADEECTDKSTKHQQFMRTEMDLQAEYYVAKDRVVGLPAVQHTQEPAATATTSGAILTTPAVIWSQATVAQCHERTLAFLKAKLHSGQFRLQKLKLENLLCGRHLYWVDMLEANQHLAGLGAHNSPHVREYHASLTALDGCYDERFIKDSFICVRQDGVTVAMFRMRFCLQLGLKAPQTITLDGAYKLLKTRGTNPK